ncbi:hypothetical protein NQ318_019053 [Aromia moschata]|uniref:Major facilitator superfamily (MFS) profile domain-containing protein n=1 Tax=Aromia moschata TaxID=1265417 RepID=A0AAV8XBZ4_9CUCU|nr:hypothetical protein NQ318_019053 [Aromia moschata]
MLSRLELIDLLATAGDVTLGWSSPVIPKLYSNDSSENPLGRPITEDEDAWLVSLISIGAMTGPFVAGFISEKFGRKVGLLSLAVPHMVSLFSMAFATNIYVFYACRLLAGISTGGGYTLLPMYIAEIAHESNRGSLSQTLNVFWAFGPETPYYLVAANKIKEAKESLLVLRSFNEEKVQKELEHIMDSIKAEESGHLRDIIKNKVLMKAFFVCIVLVISQELSGFLAITFYLQTIFEAAGTQIASDVSALIVGFFTFLSSFFTPVLIDRLGRRLLLVISCFGMVITLSMLGAFFYLQESTEVSTESIYWLPVFSLVLYIFAFHFGICSVPWTLISELFPNNVKGKLTPIITSVCWITSFLITKFFNDMNNAMGIAGSFWFFSSCCAATGIFSILMVPETKGKSFSEIQDMLNKPKARVSAGNSEDI